MPPDSVAFSLSLPRGVEAADVLQGRRRAMEAVGERTAMGSIGRELDDLAASYRSECAHGVPMSVHERYERQLGTLRRTLRSVPTPCRLGDVLKHMGAVDEQRLTDALSVQAVSESGKLLGEILIDLGWASEQAIRQAAELQAAAYQETEASVVGASRQ